jgi:serine protease Do
VPTSLQTPTDGNIFRKQATSFAIPINTVNKIAKELIMNGEIRRGWLGVWIKQRISETQPPTPSPSPFQRGAGGLLSKGVRGLYGKGEGMPAGVQIIQFADNSPAAQAGLKLNDAVVAFNDKAIRTTYDLKRFVADSRPDTNVKLKIIREGKELSVNVKLGERNK